MRKFENKKKLQNYQAFSCKVESFSRLSKTSALINGFLTRCASNKIKGRDLSCVALPRIRNRLGKQQQKKKRIAKLRGCMQL